MPITINRPDEPTEYLFVGTTLCEREENYYDDSDGYSHVYDPESGKIIRHGTWTTRASTYYNGKTDAYDDDNNPLRDEMRQAHIDSLTRLWLGEQSREYDNASAVARTPKKGDYVVVAKGRKVPKGTEGIIFWMKPDEYSYNYHTKDYDANRIGIDIGGGPAVWTSDRNVVVLDPDMPDPADYIGEVEYRKGLAGLTLKQLHGMLCQYNSRLAYVR